jgi:hypothetical protein
MSLIKIMYLCIYTDVTIIDKIKLKTIFYDRIYSKNGTR